MKRLAASAALALVVLGLGACTRAGFGRGPAADAGADAGVDAGVDAGADGGEALRARAPFGTGRWQLGAATAVRELNSDTWDGEACVVADGLTAYLASYRSGGLGGRDVYVARRPRRDAAFGAPVSLGELNTAGEDALTAAPDDLGAYLVTERPGGAGGEDVWYAARADPSVPWASSMFAPLVEVNSALADWDPWPTADGLELYLAPSQPGGPAAQQLQVALRADRSARFEAPRALDELRAPGAKTADPTLSPDMRVIVYTHGADLWYAVRARQGEPFAAPQPLLQLNTDADEAEACISADGTELHFSSDRPGGLGSLDIWVAPIEAGP